MNKIFDEIIKKLEEAKKSSLAIKRTGDYRIGLIKAIDIIREVQIEQEHSMLQVVNRCFSSKEELAKHIQMNMPLAVKPTKKAKTVFINPFTSENARQTCIDSIVNSLLK